MLQAVNLFWFFLILRILYRFVRTGEEKDERSEDEEVEDLIEETKTNGHSEKPEVMFNGQPIAASAAGGVGGLRKR